MYNIIRDYRRLGIMDIIDAEWIKRHLPNERGSQAALARATGISPDHLSKILSGDRAVQGHEVPKIYGYFYPTNGELEQDPRLIEFADLWRQLTKEEQDFLRNAAKAQLSARNSPQK